MSIVSVIVPVYNCSEYLSDCISSLTNQTYKNIDVVFVDDESTDNSVEIINTAIANDPRFRIIKQENHGPSFARNRAIEQAKGDFILPLDADDKICDNYIESCLKTFSLIPEVKLVYGKAEYFGEKSGIWELPEYSYHRILKENIIFCTAMYRKVEALKVGMYDEQLINGYEDWEFWLNLLNPDDLVCRIDDAIFYYRIKKQSRNINILNDKVKSNHALNYIITKHLGKYGFENISDLYVAYDNAQMYGHKINNQFQNLHKKLTFIQFFKLLIKKIINWSPR